MITPQDLSLPSRFSSFRPHQAESILRLAQSSSRFLGLNSPTGSGKSLTYLSYALLTGARVLILVGTKSLEDQIYRDASAMGGFDIRGHSNYKCSIRSFDDITGEMSDFECSARRLGIDCQHKLDTEIAKSKQIVTSNYANWFQFQKVSDPDRLGKFDLLVIDEADTVHSSLVDHVSILLYDRILSRFADHWPSTDSTADLSLSDWLSFARDLIPKVDHVLDELSAANAPRKEIFPVEHLARSLRRILDEISPNPSAWRVLDHSECGTGGTKFSPVWGSAHAQPYLFRGIEKVMLVSATVSHSTFRQLGIPTDQYDYLETPSCFDPARRPFYYLPTEYIKHNMDEGKLRMAVSSLDSIISRRLDRRGIVHTISYDWAERIHAKSKHRSSNHLLLHKRGMNTADLIERFKHDPIPHVLLSPVVEQGYSFDDDFARYQYLWKLPRIDARGPLEIARAKDDPDYLNQLMADRIQQIYGRSTRSQSDWSETFIGDKYWGGGNRPFRAKAGMFHPWFRDGWKDVSSVPEPLNF